MREHVRTSFLKTLADVRQEQQLQTKARPKPLRENEDEALPDFANMEVAPEAPTPDAPPPSAQQELPETAAVTLAILNNPSLAKRFIREVKKFAKEAADNIAATTGRMAPEEIVIEEIARMLKEEFAKLPKVDPVFQALMQVAAAEVNWTKVASDLVAHAAREAEPDFAGAEGDDAPDFEDSEEKEEGPKESEKGSAPDFGASEEEEEEEDEAESDFESDEKEKSGKDKKESLNESGSARVALQSDPFFRQYVATALWSSNDESTPEGGEPFDKNYDETDIADESLQKMLDDCVSFQAHAEQPLSAAYSNGYEASRAGHDFWLTRNGHGTGFWDRDELEGGLGKELTRISKEYPECDLYIGDDGSIYIS